jgi:hypothetical protein
MREAPPAMHPLAPGANKEECLYNQALKPVGCMPIGKALEVMVFVGSSFQAKHRKCHSLSDDEVSETSALADGFARRAMLTQAVHTWVQHFGAGSDTIPSGVMSSWTSRSAGRCRAATMASAS